MAAIEIEAIITGISDRFQLHDVLIDGDRCGTVKGGETRQFEVSPGIHTVKLRLGSHFSPSVKVVVGFGKTSVVCRTTGRRLFGLFSSAEATMEIRVREEPDAAQPRGERVARCGDDTDLPARMVHALGA